MSVKFINDYELISKWALTQLWVCLFYILQFLVFFMCFSKLYSTLTDLLFFIIWPFYLKTKAKTKNSSLIIFPYTSGSYTFIQIHDKIILIHKTNQILNCFLINNLCKVEKKKKYWNVRDNLQMTTNWIGFDE